MALSSPPQCVCRRCPPAALFFPALRSQMHHPPAGAGSIATAETCLFAMDPPAHRSQDSCPLPARQGSPHGLSPNMFRPTKRDLCCRHNSRPNGNIPTYYCYHLIWAALLKFPLVYSRNLMPFKSNK
ncbi:hypothetical protein P691DRAFT_388985 [Macrolepiota fuliginosa MF-IS2]|uniref:Uncharacterized protein n=1 Tax=Macrolepiota fuliginosa MF-IS2 TaxID=1400762 RepID=A0A9P5X5G8_9AGAR|nr:hypothetical protein P691DRAFT_388985 [Macrolepiota fuliginosa MF-IS2]